MAPSKSISSSTTKKPKAKASSTSRPVKSSLSTELVQDSDESDEEVNSSPQKKNGTLIKPTSSASRPPVPAQPAKLADFGERPSKKRKISTSSPTEPCRTHGRATATDESQSDTEDDNTNVSSSPDSSPTPAKQKRISDHSSQGASDKALKSSSSKDKAEQNGSKAKALSTVDQSEDETTEEDASESSENESHKFGESESEDEERSSSEESSQSSLRREEPSSQPVRPYEPPPGFKPATVSVHPSSEISEILEPSNLKDKQIWHITAPALVPLTSVKEVAVQDIRDGATIVSHKGSDYGFAPEISAGQATDHTLILPSAHSNEYRLSKITITKTLHLQQLITLPTRAIAHSDIPASITSRPRTHVKVPRQQPPGLRMRYHPFGAPEDSDSDGSESTRPVFRAPQPVASGSPKRQRNHASTGNNEHAAQISPVKKKKEKHSHEKRADTLGAAMDIDAPIDKGSSRTKSPSIAVNGNLSSDQQKRKKDRKQHHQDKVPAAAQSLLPADLTKEAETIVPEEVVSQDIGINKVHLEEGLKLEKARRKEARRLRKELEPTKHQPNGQSEDPSIGLASPRDTSPKKPVRQESPNRQQASSQDAPPKETKEHRAKRKEEKRKRKVALKTD